ncbi:MAG: alginate lyase family protein [Opitutaceae bacterium]
MLFLPVAHFDLRAFERARVVHIAEAVLNDEPRTITSVLNPRSSGGPHDFSSEGDYWWPDPKNPEGPYVRRDGESNPANFVAHRLLLMRFAREEGALLAAYDLTHEEKFAAAATRHLRAWFIDPATRMNPNLQFAQAIKGVCPGRGTGLIDTVHLAEMAVGIPVLRGSAAFTPADEAAVTDWFRRYLIWMRTSPDGIAEREADNNHGTCWTLQAAAFARLTGDQSVLAECRRRFIGLLLPGQMAVDGSFPRELARTKPYSYSLFNLDAMTALADILSTPSENMLAFRLPDGRGLVRGIEFLAPYVADKSKWPHPPDVMYWAQWPMRQASLIFGYATTGNLAWLDTWKRLPADSGVEEVRRNLIVRFPTLWIRPLP